MLIKEQNEKHMVIGMDFHDYIGLMFAFIGFIVLIIGTIFFTQIIVRVFCIIGSVFGFVGLIVFGKISSLIIYKGTESVIIKKRFLLFIIPVKRIIKFSDVHSIWIEYRPKSKYGGGSSPAWLVALQLIGDRVEIDHTDDETEMLYLAREISSYMNKELVSNYNIPKSL